MPSESVLITGCSDGGIGSALAFTFQQRGFQVFATARNTAKMSELKNLANVTLLTLDVTNSEEIGEAVDAVARATGGTLDYLINNAGQNHFRPILDENIEETKDLFSTNVWGPLAITQALSPLVIKAKGSFVFVTSIAGYGNTPWMGTYSASKRSIEIIADTLRHEVQPFGVSVKMIVTRAVISKGQTYFGDFALPENSLYKRIENTIAARARGEDGITRMPTAEYATAVVDEIVKGTSGKFWYGDYAKEVEHVWTPKVPQEMLDAGAVQGTGVDSLG
ncbi:putative hydroxybutyrate dehydrogenase [Karstenula rhodostoma CBS 690.94]|uniref:Hydroxybutyrate dehydrogenase n=1 Tax=Karstenula rhodostoma CBS 690.94 TaxID=1392251 RepID=A0A9P4P9U2_9PLEO|nr:putative hydroxybutyrate dehydrogenase [Karstenula rhodostoma CBS 690.94]